MNRPPDHRLRLMTCWLAGRRRTGSPTSGRHRRRPVLVQCHGRARGDAAERGHRARSDRRRTSATTPRHPRRSPGPSIGRSQRCPRSWPHLAVVPCSPAPPFRSPSHGPEPITRVDQASSATSSNGARTAGLGRASLARSPRSRRASRLPLRARSASVFGHSTRRATRAPGRTVPRCPRDLRNRRAAPSSTRPGGRMARRSSTRGGSIRYATRAGSPVSYTFAGRSIALVTSKRPTRGKVKVYVNGSHVTTVDTYRSSAQFRAVVWQNRRRRTPARSSSS